MGYKRKEYENMESLFTNGKKKFVKYEEVATMYSMGIHAFTELDKEAKAIYRIRRIVLVNTEIIDEYMENFRDIYLSSFIRPDPKKAVPLQKGGKQIGTEQEGLPRLCAQKR